ncbi:HD domain-containing protein [Candidatus Saccharibacteria bacterium]|nr:HD domain-containing protein [Candidatus Saccharibacteria bacterium]
MSLTREYEFFEQLNELQKTRRWAEWDEVFSESVSEHTYKMIVMIDRIFDILDLDLDYRKCVRMAMYHDFGEIGMGEDVDAYIAANNIDIMTIKKQREAEKVLDISEKYKCSKIYGAWREYEKQVTVEARFVKAVDKLETVIRILNTDGKMLERADFIATYADKAIKKFPRLIPFYRVVKARMRERFEEQGWEWKKEYDTLASD